MTARALFELRYPYIYMPLNDFFHVSSLLNRIYENNPCQPQLGYCMFNDKCQNIEPKESFFINLEDENGDKKKFVIDKKIYLISGSKVGSAHNDSTCFLPIFKHADEMDYNENLYVLGNIVMSEFYTVFDMSHAEKDGYV